ncbi:hypothetical protein OAQ47_00430 [Paracoccaceae bacterium]|nr:hypothetical protein [Paracoccaceae bacterium]
MLYLKNHELTFSGIKSALYSKAHAEIARISVLPREMILFAVPLFGSQGLGANPISRE